MLLKYRIIFYAIILCLFGLTLMTVSPVFAEDSAGSDLKTGRTMMAPPTGVNTVGQSLRNANRQLRSEPANPQEKVSPRLGRRSINPPPMVSNGTTL